MILTITQMKCLLYLLLPSLLLLLLNAQEVDDNSDEFVDVTAVLLGYHVSRKLHTEETIWKFESDPAKIEDAGFLFTVLGPTDLKGMIFRLHHDGIIASGDPVTLYDPDRMYRFEISRNVLVRLDDGGCSLRPLGMPVSDSKLDQYQIDSLVEKLESRAEKARWRLDALKSRQQVVTSQPEPQEKSERFNRMFEISSLRKDIELWEGRLQVLESRLFETKRLNLPNGID